MYNRILDLSWRKSWVTLFVFIFLSVFSTNAQSWNRNSGHFDTDTPSAPTNVRVQYATVQLGHYVSILVGVDTPITLGFHAVDASYSNVSATETQNVSPRFGYGRLYDIDDLPSGTYYIEILYGDNNSQQFRIPFYKE